MTPMPLTPRGLTMQAQLTTPGTTAMPLQPPPSLYEWAGGMSAIERLMDVCAAAIRT